jgi:hypothetical protein
MAGTRGLSAASAPIVVKVGGSLYDRVPELVPVFQGSTRPLLIIPGGGIFADAVRKAALPDDESHWKAIGAMDTFGTYISSFGLETTPLLNVPEKTRILLPLRCMRRLDPLPHSWDVTSDTIAAWIAGRLGLDLLILKSVDGISSGSTLVDAVTGPVQTDVVDPFCIPMILRSGTRAVIINGTYPDRVRQFLLGKAVVGTKIGTTF